MRELGKIIASKINNAKGPSAMVIPMMGWSAYDREGGVETVDYDGKPTGRPWYDPEANNAFIELLEKHLDLSKPNVDLIKVDKHVNDPEFAELLVNILCDMIWESGGKANKLNSLPKLCWTWQLKVTFLGSCSSG